MTKEMLRKHEVIFVKNIREIITLSIAYYRIIIIHICELKFIPVFNRNRFTNPNFN